MKGRTVFAVGLAGLLSLALLNRVLPSGTIEDADRTVTVREVAKAIFGTMTIIGAAIWNSQWKSHRGEVLQGSSDLK